MRAARPLDRARLRLAAALLAAFVLVGGAAAQVQDPSPPEDPVQLDDRVFDLARQLRCPTCVSESVADSNARISREMRTQIRDQLQAGRSEAEVLAFFQERYGDWILLEPPRRGIHLLVWWLPWIAAGGGAALLITLIVRWTAKGRRVEPVEAVDRERVRAEMRDGSSGREG